MQALAQHVGLPFVDLDPLKIDAKLAPKLLSRPFARRHGALVVGADDRTVTVAVSDPLDHALVEDLRTHVRREPRIVVSTPGDIQRLITDFYGFRGAVDAAEQQATGGVDIGNLERYVKLKRVEDIEASDSHVVSAVEYLLHYALDQRASDVHIEPRRDLSVVRMRIDGVLHTVHQLPKAVHPAIVSRIKTLARLDIAEKRRPQDGRIKTARGEREVEMRVSTIAVAFGEKLVLRIFDPGALLRELPELGMFDAQLQVAERFLARPHGMHPRHGPDRQRQDDHALRGAAHDRHARRQRRDDRRPDRDRRRRLQPGRGPAEDRLRLRRGAPARAPPGSGRHHGRRGARHRDGRDRAAGRAHRSHGARHAAHERRGDRDHALLELGVDPFVLSSTLVGVVAQRLVRTVCPACRVETFLTPDQMTLLGLTWRSSASKARTPT